MLDGFNCIFGGESAHNQCQLTVGRCLDRSPINPLHILGITSAAAVHFDNKLLVDHLSVSFSLLGTVITNRPAKPAAIKKLREWRPDFSVAYIAVAPRTLQGRVHDPADTIHHWARSR